jgi:N-acetylmuramate 1-kinase
MTQFQHSSEDDPAPDLAGGAALPDQRLIALTAWAGTLPKTLGVRPSTIRVASADASFRRYFRADLDTDGESIVLMDSPPLQEPTDQFVLVSQLLNQAGLRVPRVIHADKSQGFLALDDLGNTLYLDVLNEQTATALYTEAIDALIQMQVKADAQALPQYDRALLERELRLFPDWYIKIHKKVALNEKQQRVLEQAFESILANNLAQPRAFVHRDFHSRNLMLVKGNSPGIIDFQDAVMGPMTYDLVSLLRDAYIQWDEEQVIDWVIRYWEKARAAKLPVTDNFGDFYRDFEWMGLQRHLKVLGIFARLNHRDGKSRYLADMPLVLHYVQKVCQRYIHLGPLAQLLGQIEGQADRVGYTF